METTKKQCKTCGCSYVVSKNVEKKEVASYHSDTKLAMMIALMPAMTMTLFSLMGLV